MSNQQLDKEVEEQIQQAQNDYPKHLTEAYEDFKHRLCMDYLILNTKQQQEGSKFELIRKVLNMKEGNSSAEEIDGKKCMAQAFCWLICPFIWLKTRTIFEVEANKFAFVVESSKEQGERTVIYGPGFHILGYGYKLEGVYSFDDQVPNNIISSSVGDIKIAKVEQGYIMHLVCGGQNILLGPGIHLINQPMMFRNYISLDSFFINAGPEKWITIPSGYDGISINRGSIKILEGGTQHYLPHVSDKFVKMVPLTIQTDKIPTDIPSYVHKLTYEGQSGTGNVNINDPTVFLRTITSEGAMVTLDTMLQWQIVNTKLSALTAMEILKVGTIGDEQSNEQTAIKASSRNICNLRLTVLRIAKLHLTSMVACMALSGKSSLSTQVKGKLPKTLKNELQQIPEAQEDEDYDFSMGQQYDDPLLKKNKSRKKKDAGLDNSQISQSSQGEAKQTNFDILQSLQKQTAQLKDLINQDLEKIGCIAESVNIYKVTPSQMIQQELDKQTKAKVDANTAIIQALSRQQSAEIEQSIKTKNDFQAAQAKAKVLLMDCESRAEAKITKARAEADAIKTVAKARREEAEQFQASETAKNLAVTRVIGEVGQKILSGQSNTTFYGNTPGDVINGMVTSFTQNKRK